jgi:beta-glucosidase-like glycosyl hydrolase
MSYYYDATMTKSRMEMTNFGCAQLERMAMTDIETRYSQLAQRMKDDEARIANAKERIAQAKAEMKKLTKAYNKHAANKANFESAILG